MTPAIPVSVVDFVNAWPLTWGFLRGAVEGFLPITDTPSACADRFARGEVQAGLVPAIEAARIPGVRIVRGVGIASYDRVRSVLLVSRVPIPEVRSVAVDISSRSSAAMVRLLMADLYGIRPEFHHAVPELPRMLATADAALLIGDPALTAKAEGLHVLDLAEAWNRLTGLPFVFAVWAVRRDVPPEPFLWSRDYARQRIGEIVDAAVARTGLQRKLVSEYLEMNLHHDLDEDDERGLAEFFRRAAAHGLISSPDLPPFSGVPLVPRSFS
ncbi:MAG: menaquinone biosynthesis protein [Deltaproteobacteria bacterium]|nr:menaquinone biosynthesis protein [Deltaproteobacteria bacterium]